MLETIWIFEQMPPPHFCLQVMWKNGRVFFQELTVILTDEKWSVLLYPIQWSSMGLWQYLWQHFLLLPFVPCWTTGLRSGLMLTNTLFCTVGLLQSGHKTLVSDLLLVGELYHLIVVYLLNSLPSSSLLPPSFLCPVLPCSTLLQHFSPSLLLFFLSLLPTSSQHLYFLS